jgi:hypothetical protein
MRLIDAEHLKWNVGGIKCGTLTVDYLNWILEHEEPTVDAVPVIRCKDCQYWMKNPYRESSVFGLCFKHKDIAIATDETDWCSWAERKEE